MGRKIAKVGFPFRQFISWPHGMAGDWRWSGHLRRVQPAQEQNGPLGDSHTGSMRLPVRVIAFGLKDQ
jgi:hypothetical protein